MTLRDLLELSIGNLWRIKLRAFLTIAGVLIAIAAFVSLLSFGAGNQKFIRDQFEKFGLFTMIEVYPRTEENGDDTTAVAPLDEAAIRQLSEIPGVELVFPFDQFEVTAYVADTHVATTARVLSSAGVQSRIFQAILDSVTFSSDTAKEAVVTEDFLKDIGIDDADSLINRELVIVATAFSLDSAILNVVTADKGGSIFRRLRNIRFDSLFDPAYRQRIMQQEFNESLKRFVDGLMNRKLTVSDTLIIKAVATVGSGIRTYPIIVPEGTARRLSKGGYGVGSDPVDMLAAAQRGTFFAPEEAADSRNYPKVTLEFDPYSPYRPIKDSVEALGYRAFSYAEQFEEMQRFFLYYNLGLGIIGLIALVTASLGIVNTMVMSITERRREIGIIKSLGADEREIRLLFLVESAVIGALGAVIGIFVGWVATRIVSAVFQAILEREEIPAFDPFALPPWLILLAFAFGLIVSLLAGMYPAARAARVDPVEALRAE